MLSKVMNMKNFENIINQKKLFEQIQYYKG